MAGPYVKDIYLPSGIATLTWAELFALNAASYNPGQIFYVTDVGVGGSYWYSTGVRWRAVNGALWLHNPTTPVAHSGAATTEKLGELTIPAGLLQAGDILETHVTLDCTAGGSSGVTTMRMGLTGIVTDTSIQTMSQPSGSNLYASWNKRHTAQATPTQIRLDDTNGAGGLGGSATSALSTFTVPDLIANAVKLTVWLQEGTGGVRVATLRHFAVELMTVGP